MDLCQDPLRHVFCNSVLKGTGFMHKANKAQCEVINHISNILISDISQNCIAITPKENYKGSLFTVNPISEPNSFIPQIKLSRGEYSKGNSPE